MIPLGKKSAKMLALPNKFCGIFARSPIFGMV